MGLLAATLRPQKIFKSPCTPCASKSTTKFSSYVLAEASYAASTVRWLHNCSAQCRYLLESDCMERLPYGSSDKPSALG